MKALLLLAFIGAAFAATDFERKCTPKAEAGPCKAKKLRWWFNTETGKCETFFYGGCLGNENRYLKKTECEKTCSPQTTNQNRLSAFSNKKSRVPAFGGDVCSRPPYSGPCKAMFRRYYYDASSKTCRPFIYGGCRSNGNNFPTKSDCMNACGRRVPVAPRPRYEEA